jgi:hypothetical protein
MRFLWGLWRFVVGCRHPHTIRVKRDGRWFLQCSQCFFVREMNPASRGEKMLRYQTEARLTGEQS